MIKETVEKIQKVQEDYNISFLVLGKTQESAEKFTEQLIRTYVPESKLTVEHGVTHVLEKGFTFEIKTLEETYLPRTRAYDFVFIEGLEDVIKTVSECYKEQNNEKSLTHLLFSSQSRYGRAVLHWKEKLESGDIEDLSDINLSMNQRFLSFNQKLPTFLEQSQKNSGLNMLFISYGKEESERWIERITKYYKQEATNKSDDLSVSKDFEFHSALWENVDLESISDYDLVITDHYIHDFRELKKDYIELGEKAKEMSKWHLDTFELRFHF